MSLASAHSAARIWQRSGSCCWRLRSTKNTIYLRPCCWISLRDATKNLFELFLSCRWRLGGTEKKERSGRLCCWRLFGLLLTYDDDAARDVAASSEHRKTIEKEGHVAGFCLRELLKRVSRSRMLRRLRSTEEQTTRIPMLLVLFGLLLGIDGIAYRVAGIFETPKRYTMKEHVAGGCSGLLLEAQ
jgi:hypothetical protein